MSKKRIQLRRCQFCNKPGHNKATCPDFLISQKNSELPSLQKNDKKLRIFYHAPDQKNSDTVSPHLLSLKSKTSHWQDMEVSSPEQNSENWEKVYLEIKNQVETKKERNIEKYFILPEKEEVETPTEKSYFSKEKNKIEEKGSEYDLDFLKIIENIHKPEKKEVVSKIEKPTKSSKKIKNPINFTFPVIFKKINWQKSFSTAMIGLVLIALPLQTNSFYKNIKISTDKIASNGTVGFMALQDSAAAIITANLPAAQNSITEALQNFSLAIEEIQTHKILQKIAVSLPLVKSEVQSRQNLILAGQKLALGNTYLIKGISEANNPDILPLNRLDIISNHLKSAIPNYTSALEDLNNVKIDVLPFEYQSSFEDFIILFENLLADLKSISDLSQNINEIFGNTGLRRYLLVFQNEAEIRPTGGFMGSFAVMDIKNGKIENIEIPPGGSYDLQGQLSVLVEPPTPLLLSNKKWEFQDANWFPDFKESAEKTLWFYRHSRNITLDGVIAINSSVLQRLLSLVGPLEDEKRGLELTEKTALISIQSIVETGPEKKENKPKQILTDLTPKFLDSIFALDPKNTLPLLFNLNEALEQKEIQVYFTSPYVQSSVEKFGWGGRITQTPEGKDYLMVINTNIQGQKSDAQIKQKIQHQTMIEKDGSIINSITITRTHRGTYQQNLYDQTNISYIRLYTPRGSELITAHGFTWPDEKYFRAPAKGASKDETLALVEEELGFHNDSGTRITNEFGKTAFGNWVITEPGTISTVQFIYRLPFKAFALNKNENKNLFENILMNPKIISQYQLILQRQSGDRSTFESQVIYPEGWESNWSYGENSSLATNGYFVPEIPLKTDKIWSLLMEKTSN